MHAGTGPSRAEPRPLPWFPLRFGFQESDILCLTEDDAVLDHTRLPTRHNIMAGLRRGDAAGASAPTALSAACVV